MPKRRTPQSDANDMTTPTPQPAAAPRRRRSTRPKGTAKATQPTEAAKSAIETAQQPNEQDIRQHAYHLYLERRGGPGSDFDDWVRAEQELKMKRAKS